MCYCCPCCSSARAAMLGFCNSQQVITMLLSVDNHLWELLTEGKEERLSIMLNPAWKSPKGGGSTALWPWGAFRAPYHAPGNILPQLSKALTCPSMATQQGHRQPGVCAQQLCFLKTPHNKMTRKRERGEFHLLFYKTEDEGRKYFFCNITHIMEKAWLITRACVVPGATREISSLDLQEWHG